MDIKKLLALAEDAAIKAGKEILDVYSKTEHISSSEKTDGSPLTEADRRAHAVISEALNKTGIPVISEEGASTPYAVRSTWPVLWMVDPLDGTKEFISRNGDFTVNIALIQNGVPIAGVVYVPVSGTLYSGATGFGAWRTVGDGAITQLPKAGTKNSGPTRIVASRSHLNKETQDFIDAYPDAALVQRGSSLKFMLIADQLADIYPRFGPTMEWDTAAAHAVVKALGYSVAQAGTDGQELVYNKPDLLNPYFVVSNAN